MLARNREWKRIREEAKLTQFESNDILRITIFVAQKTSSKNFAVIVFDASGRIPQRTAQALAVFFSDWNCFLESRSQPAGGV